MDQISEYLIVRQKNIHTLIFFIDQLLFFRIYFFIFQSVLLFILDSSKSIFCIFDFEIAHLS